MAKLMTIKQAIIWTLGLLLSAPALAFAGVKLDNTINIDAGLSLKVGAMFLTALAGGISSTFINTSFDANMKHPALAKIWIGACLGLVGSMFIFERFELGLFTILLPTFALASLGAPIMVFYLMWISKPDNQAELIETIKDIVRIKRGKRGNEE